jgi:4-hydroxy-tetrahydrodipicolinate synthase
VHKLADDERRAIVERVLARVKGRAPVWVGSGHQSTALVIAHSLHAQERGAAGVMVMPPYVAKPPLAQLAQFFRDLDAAIRLPIMIQDAPLVSGLHLPSDWLLDLAAKCRNVVAVKVEAPPTGPKTGDLAQRSNGRLAVVGGLGGGNLVDELRRGAVGTLPGSAFPEWHLRIVRSFRAGDVAAAEREHARLLPLVRFVSQSVEFSYHAYKRILVKRGVLADAHVRRPTCSFDDLAAAELDRLLSASELR